MSRRLAVIVCAGLIGLVAPDTATATYRRASCPPRAGILVAADANAEVWLGYGSVDSASPSYYACAYGRDRWYDLGPPLHGIRTGNVGTGAFHLAGSMVAYETFDEIARAPGSLIQNDIVVRDLIDGRVLHKLPTGAATEPETIGVGEVYSLVLKPDGAVAWIAGSVAEYQLHAADAQGAREIAAGPTIAPLSLALAGSTLYWTEAGKPDAATLS